MCRISIVISTCKKYEKVFLKFWHIFKNYDFYDKYDIYILTDKRLDFTFFKENVKVFEIDKEWGTRTRLLLEQIDSEYILHILEDFIIEKVDYNRFNKLITHIEKNKDIGNIIFEDLSQDNSYKLESEIYVRDQYANYKTSLQMGIWKKEIFQKLLSKNYSPWEFEIFANIRTYNMKEKFLCIKNSPIVYNNGLYVVQGYVNKKEAIRLKEIFNVDFLNVGLPIREKIIRDDVSLFNRIIRRIKIIAYKVVYKYILKNN